MRVHESTTMHVCGAADAGAGVLRYCHEQASKTDMEEKKLMNKVVIFVFFAHKKYSRSFIKLRLNHDGLF